VPVTPSDEQLVAALRAASIDAAAISRRPYRYATSHPLEEVRVRGADGAERTLILKQLAPRPAEKPAFLHEPLRELLALREILAPAGVGPQLIAGDATWLLLEHVSGVELWQVGDGAVWESVAAWLGDFHAAFVGRSDELRAANPHLLVHTASWYERWRDRAVERLQDAADPRAAEVLLALKRYDAQALALLPQTLIHGELYPSNVLVDPPRVCPVDWEMAAIGPGVIDLAALCGGWETVAAARLTAAYGPVDASDLARACLHLALQWLGWSAGWKPPPEHSHDWLGEALALVRELGL
jgi:aminoglycoside phosphotransferase (APT) family kinase protein